MLATPRYVIWMPSSPCMGSDSHARPQGFDSLARLLPFGTLWNSAIYQFFINKDAFFSLSGFWILLPCIVHPSYLFHFALLYLSSHCTLNRPAPTTFRCLHCSWGLRTEGERESREREGYLVCNLTMFVPLITNTLPTEIFCDPILERGQILSSSLVFLINPSNPALPLVAVLAFAYLCVHTSLLLWFLVWCPLSQCPGIFCPYVCHLQGLCSNCERT